MSISKWVNLTFAGIFILAFLTLTKTIEWGFLLAEAQRLDRQIMGQYVTLSTLLGALGAVAFTFYLYRKPNMFSYMSEVVIELQRTTWPSMDETRRSTIVVIVFTIVLSGFLAIFDWIWKNLTDLLILSS